VWLSSSSPLFGTGKLLGGHRVLGGAVSLQTSAGAFRFGGFLLDLSAGGLFRVDELGCAVAIPLGSRALDVLVVLVEHHGVLVSRQSIMDAVWPGTAVEDNNLAVQISALRRVLDEGRQDGSCIQTVPGRGYRLVTPIGDDAVQHAPAEPPQEAQRDTDTTAPAARAPAAYRLRRAWPAALLLAGLGLVLGIWLLADVRFMGQQEPPRLSLVVLPFENLSGDPKDDYLAEAITDDLTTDLSNIADAFVIARETAYAFKGKPTDVRKIGEELGVRYVIEGSVRRIGSALRVNVQLTSAESGAYLWSGGFAEQIVDLAAGQEQIVARMRSELGISLVEIEKARSLRERPTSPDAFDLILQARSLANQPPSLKRNDAVKVLYERALERDPASVEAMLGIAYYLVDRRATTGSWRTLENMQRADSLLGRARQIAPGSRMVLSVTAYRLRALGQWGEAMQVADEEIQRFPNYVAGYHDLAHCKTATGHAEDEIALEEKAIRMSPRSPYLFERYLRIGYASLLLGRDEDAITSLQRSLAVSRDDDGNRPWTYRQLAAAYARTGRSAEAKRALAEADRLYPYYHTARIFVPDPAVPIYAEQIRRLQDALRLAGERDHTDEDGDFGVAADAVLHGELAAPTPKGGARSHDGSDPGSCRAALGNPASSGRRILLHVRPVVTWRNWARQRRTGRQLYGHRTGSPASQAADADRRRPQPAGRRGGVEFGKFPRTKSRPAPRGTRLYECLLVSRRTRGVGGGRAAREALDVQEW
jgi:TolB-like protein/DNA-binding winged helix-turn-helix (wHTH) protein